MRRSNACHCMDCKESHDRCYGCSNCVVLAGCLPVAQHVIFRRHPSRRQNHGQGRSQISFVIPDKDGDGRNASLASHMLLKADPLTLPTSMSTPLVTLQATGHENSITASIAPFWLWYIRSRQVSSANPHLEPQAAALLQCLRTFTAVSSGNIMHQ